VDWNAVWPGPDRPRRVPLAAYPFDRRRCWRHFSRENALPELVAPVP
jgi:hypothetical protein